MSPRFSPFQFSGFTAVILPRLLILEIFTPLNAPLPNVSRLGNERSSISSEVQLLNAFFSIVTKDEGNVIFVRAVHPPKALAFIVVKDEGNVTFVRALYLYKAFHPISVIVSGRIISSSIFRSPNVYPDSLASVRYVNLPKLLILLIFTFIKAPLLIEVKFGRAKSSISKDVHPLNALLYIAVIDDGKSILVKAVHPLNAASPIVLREDGRFIPERAEHPINEYAPIVSSVSGRIQDSRFSHLAKTPTLSCNVPSHCPFGNEVIVPRFSTFFIPLCENAAVPILVRFGAFNEKLSSKDPILKNA